MSFDASGLDAAYSRRALFADVAGAYLPRLNADVGVQFYTNDIGTNVSVLLENATVYDITDAPYNADSLDTSTGLQDSGDSNTDLTYGTISNGIWNLSAASGDYVITDEVTGAARGVILYNVGDSDNVFAALKFGGDITTTSGTIKGLLPTTVASFTFTSS